MSTLAPLDPAAQISSNLQVGPHPRYISNEMQAFHRKARHCCRRDITLLTARLLAFGVWHPTLRPVPFVTRPATEGSPSPDNQVGPDRRLVGNGNANIKCDGRAGKDFLRMAASSPFLPRSCCRGLNCEAIDHVSKFPHTSSIETLLVQYLSQGILDENYYVLGDFGLVTTSTVIKGRLVAFLDVLGFSAKLKEIPLSELFASFATVVDEIKTKTFFQIQGDQEGRTNFEFAQFMSDSLILVSNPINDPYNVNNFIAAVSDIMHLGFKEYFPFRGAITLSDVIYDDRRNIFLANKFPDVVRFEGQQEWSGCVILDEAKEAVTFGYAVSEPPQNRVTDLLHLVEVPLKNGHSSEMVCVNFMFPLCFEKFSDQLNHLTEPKKTNTEKHFTAIAESGFEAQSLTDEFLPAIYVVFMKTRTGFRSVFLDKDMHICEPGCKEFAWTAVGEKP